MELKFDKYKEQQFCDNPKCSHANKIGEGNIRTHSRKHRQVYCNQCGNIWTITKDTFFYHLKTPVKVVIEVLLLLSEGMGVNAVCRAKGVTADAISGWILKAGKHVREVTQYLEGGMHLTQCQIDEFWSFIYKKKAIVEKRREIGRIAEIVGDS